MLNFSMVFPGQGSQSMGMLKALSESYPIVLETFDIASKVLGFDCWALAQLGPESVLNQTKNTQPVLLAADIALWRVYTRYCDARPTWLAGHSLGEYAALVAAQAISFEDAIEVVAKRGQFMQAAAPIGQNSDSMAAVLNVDNHLIEQACHEVNELNKNAHQLVAPANYNAIGQTVISGHTQSILQAIELMKSRGAKRIIMLPVSVPSHCALMQPAADQLAVLLDTIEIKTPLIPILHNSDVQTHLNPKEIKRILCEQLVKPVRWVETIQRLSENKVKYIIECGPGKVLAGLIKRIDSDLPVYNIDTPASLSEMICLKPIP